jgi:hypothetical protein
MRDVQPLTYHAVPPVRRPLIILHRAPVRYAAFGLTLVSRYPLPLPPAVDVCDEIEIGFDPSSRHAPADGGPRRRTWTAHASGGELLFEDGGGYRLSIDIARDRMTIAFNRPDEDVAGVILGAAMGALLHLRGTPALHGTAIARRGGAYVIGGAAGAGKTTLAGALASSGDAQLLSDDLSALQLQDDGRCAVWRGSPGRLTADEAARAGVRHAVTDTPGTDGKHWVRPVGQIGAPIVVPLRAVVMLEPRTRHAKPVVEQLPRAVACARLASSLYGGGWLDVPRDARLATGARLSDRTPVYRAALPDDRASLPAHAIDLLTALERDCGSA